MKAVHITKTVTVDGSVVLDNLPFVAGDQVEITIEAKQIGADEATRNKLSGSVLEYHRPFDPVADNDWEATQ